MIRRIALLGLSLLVGYGVSGCGVVPYTSFEKIESGYAGLKVQQYGADKGIDGAELITGGTAQYNGWDTDVYKYPVFKRAYPFTSNPNEGSTDKDESVGFAIGGTPVSLNLGVTYGFNIEQMPGKPEGYTYLHDLFKNYRVGPDDFRATLLRNALRDCAATQSIALGLNPLTLNENLPKLTQGIRTCLGTKFPQVDITEVSSLSNPKLPENIQQAINKVYESKQQAASAVAEQERAKAEGGAKLATAQADAAVSVTKAEAEAKANQLLSAATTPIVIELKRLEVEANRVGKWDGKMAPTVQTPSVQLGGGAAN